MTENIVIAFETTGLPSTIQEMEKLGQVTKKDADAFTQAGNAAEDAGKKSSEAAKNTKNEFERLEARVRSIAERIVAAFAIERVIDFSKEAVKSFAAAEAAAHKLEFSLNAITGGGKSAFNSLIESSEKLSKTTFFSPRQIQEAQAQAAAFGLNADQIKKLIPTTLNLATVMGSDLPSAIAIQLRSIEGQTRGLKEAGQDFKATGDRAKNFELLLAASAKGAGQAEAALNTTQGTLKNLAKNYEIAKEKLGGFLVGLVGGTKDANEESLKSIAINQAVAKSTQSLLNEYESLTKTGVAPTAEEKKRLTAITYQLRDALGESVVNIDKETGALILNKDAVKEAIKQKLLLANQEASTLALQINALKESGDQQNVLAKDAQADIESRIDGLKKLGLTQKDIDDRTKEVVSQQLGSKFNQEQKAFLDTLINLDDKRKIASNSANESDKERVVLLEKLKKLGFDEIEVQKLFNAEVAKKQTNTLGKTPEELEKEAAAAKRFLEKKETFLEELRKKFASSEITEIQDQNEKKRAEAIAAFQTDVAFIEKGVREKLIDATKAGADILRLEENLGKALLVIDEENRAEQEKRASQTNKEQADKDFKITVANAELQEQAELSAIEESYQKQTDHSVKAEEKKQKQLIKIKIKYLEYDKLLHEDDPAKITEDNKKILALKTQLGEADLKVTEDTEKKKKEIKKQIFNELKQLGAQLLQDALFYSQAQAQADEQALQKKSDENAKANDEASKSLQKKFDRGLISEAKFNSEKKKLDDRKANEDAIIRKKQNEIKHEQDLAERARKLFEIAIQTAVNIVQFPLLTGFYLALGAAQSGVILAAPLPKYHSGRLAKTSSNEEHAIVRKDETIFPPDLSREFEPSFNAIYNRKIKPATLNEFVSYKLKGGDLSQNITASIDYERLGRTTAEWMVHKMKGMKQTVDIGNARELADLLKSDRDPRFRG